MFDKNQFQMLLKYWQSLLNSYKCYNLKNERKEDIADVLSQYTKINLNAYLTSLWKYKWNINSLLMKTILILGKNGYQVILIQSFLANSVRKRKVFGSVSEKCSE